MQHFEKTENPGNWAAWHMLQKAKQLEESAAIWPTDGLRCFSIMFFIWLAILYLSHSGLFSRQVPACLQHKRLNIGCYIKEVTNQADGERCQRVSILQGRCLSLGKPTPSALTSNNPAHTHSTCTCKQCTQAHIGIDTHIGIHMHNHFYPEHVYASMCSYIHIGPVYTWH